MKTSLNNNVNREFTALGEFEVNLTRRLPYDFRNEANYNAISLMHKR